MENQKLMGIGINAPVEAPLGPWQGNPPRKCLERAHLLGAEPGHCLAPGPPAGSRNQTDAEIADLAFVAHRKVGIGEAEIFDKTFDRRVQPKYERAYPRAQPYTAKPLMQLIRRQVADFHEVNGAISPSSSNS